MLSAFNAFWWLSTASYGFNRFFSQKRKSLLLQVISAFFPLSCTWWENKDRICFSFYFSLTSMVSRRRNEYLYIFRTWLNGRDGDVLAVGLDDHSGLFQLQWFYKTPFFLLSASMSSVLTANCLSVILDWPLSRGRVLSTESRVKKTFSLKKPLSAQMEDVTAMHHHGQPVWVPVLRNGSSLSVHLCTVKRLWIITLPKMWNLCLFLLYY